MKTRIGIVISILLVASIACKTAQDTGHQAASAAKTAVSGELAAAALIAGYQIEAAAPQLIAISNRIANVPGSWMYVSDVQKVAVFIAKAGKDAQGLPFYFVGSVNIEAPALVDTGDMLADLGVDYRKLHTLEDITTALRSRGFVEKAPIELPALVATLRAAISMISSFGNAAVHLIVAPGGSLTPEAINPWCGRELDCENWDELPQN